MKTFRIGRAQDNDIVLNVPSISSHHAELTYGDDDSIVYTDYSTNGTTVNGQMVNHASVMVNYGDPITLPGGVQLDWTIFPVPQPPQVAQESVYNVGTQVNSPGATYGEAQTYTEQPQYGGNVYGGVPPYQNASANDSQGYNAAVGGATLSFSRTMSEGWRSGLRNSLSFVAIFILVALTCWIPYINMGVFVALSMLPVKWANGEVISPLEIFRSEYRRQIGNYALLQLLMFGGLLFTILTCGVFAFAWMLAPMMLLYRDMNPLEAMNASNRATYGSKWTIFGIILLYSIVWSLVLGIIGGLGTLIALGMGIENSGATLVVTAIFGLIAVVVSVIAMSVGIGIWGSIWNQLKDKTEY